MTFALTVLVICLSALLSTVVWRRHYTAAEGVDKLPLPPGSLGWPIIGESLSFVLRVGDQIYISTYTNLRKCLSASLCVCVCTAFRGHFETVWDTLWHKVSFRPRMSSKTIKFKKKVIFRRVIALFLYFFKISL